MKLLPRKMRRLLTQLRFLYDLRDITKLNNQYTSGVAKSDEEILAIRKLHAKTYLHFGNVSPEAVTEEGLLDEKTDPYVADSTYFYVKNLAGELQIVGRFIMNGASVSHEAKVHGNFTLPDNLHYSDMIEVASVAKAKGSPRIVQLLLYREMIRYSRQNNMQEWAMFATAHMKRSLEQLFAHTFTEMGEPFKIPYGTNIVHPLHMNIDTELSGLEQKVSSMPQMKQRIFKRILAVLNS